MPLKIKNWDEPITAEEWQQLDEVLNNLEPLAQEIIRLRYGLKDEALPAANEWISEELRLTPWEVQKIHTAAKTKLRHPRRLRPLMKLAGIPRFAPLIDALIGTDCRFQANYYSVVSEFYSRWHDTDSESDAKPHNAQDQR